MNLAGLVVLFGVYTAIVAAIAALILGVARSRRRPVPAHADVGPAIPKVDGLRVRRAPLQLVNAGTAIAAPVTPPAAQTTAALVPAGSRSSVPQAAAVATPDRAPLTFTSWDDWTGQPPDVVAADAGTSESRSTAPFESPAEHAVEPVPHSDLSPAVVFAAGDALLPEGLRTLDVSPNRTIEPGKTVRAAFTLRNPGGSPATGFRARFRLPAGLAYARGSAQIDGTPVPDRDGATALLMPSGAELGAIPAGGECRVALEYVVCEPLENGTAIALQAAVASPDVAAIGSNVVRLVVRSRPSLQNARTTLSTNVSGELHPGDEFGVCATVHNSGQSSAHDLVIMLPVPAHVGIVPNSLTVDDHPVADPTAGDQFRFARPTVAAPLLAPGETLTVAYRLRIDSPLEDATPIVVAGTVAAQEVAQFTLPPVTVSTTSMASFADGAAQLRVDVGDEVEPGERIAFALRAHNVGTATARDAAVHFTLPDGLTYVAGSLTIDGALAPDRGAASGTLTLGDLAPGRTLDVAIVAIVQSPLADGTRLTPRVQLTWSTGERGFERELAVCSAPRFPPEFNRIDRETPLRVGPSAAVGYTVVLTNLGTDVAGEARLTLTADEAICNLCVRDGDAALPIESDGSVALSPLVPGVARRIRIDGQIARIVADQTPVNLHAVLRHASGAWVDLGTAAHVVESQPRFSTAGSHITSDTPGARLKQVSRFRLTLTNEGTDCAHDVRVAIDIPAELQIDGVEEALLAGNAVVFGEIPAGEERSAHLRVRLVGVVSGGDPITIAARVSGANVVPLNLIPIDLETSGEAGFADGASLSCTPASAVRAGADIDYTLRLHNSGDGPAKHLTARIAHLTNAVYAQGTTTVNAVALADRDGSSLLHSDAGLQLAGISVGVDIVVAWRVIVNMPLPPESIVACEVEVTWDDAPPIMLQARAIDVVSLAALPVINPELPFTVLGATEAHR